MERHPFDVEIVRIAPGRTPYPFHLHSAQWEFYHVLSGTGGVRHTDGITPIGPGDAFLFKPNEPHQLINDGAQDLVLYVVADNRSESQLSTRTVRSGACGPRSAGSSRQGLDYYDGEE